MGEIGNQLGQLLVQSIPTIVFVLFLVAFLNRLFFKPLSQTLEARAKATSGALAEAREQAEKAGARMAEYEKSIQAARQEIYHHREAARRDALGKRDIQIQGARSHAETLINAAQEELEKETLLAKSELRAAADSLAIEVADAFFAPRIAPGGRGGVQA